MESIHQRKLRKTQVPENMYNLIGQILEATKDSTPHTEPYMHTSEQYVWPIAAVRSAHLPGDSTDAVRERFDDFDCPACHEPVVQLTEFLDNVEHRWRHIQHALLMCKRSADSGLTPAALQRDLLSIAREADEIELQSAIELAFYQPDNPRPHRSERFLDWNEARRAMWYLVDPITTCTCHGAMLSTAKKVQQITAAYILGTSMLVTQTPMDDLYSRAQALPSGSLVRKALLSMTPQGSAEEPDSDAEIWAGGESSDDEVKTQYLENDDAGCCHTRPDTPDNARPLKRAAVQPTMPHQEHATLAPAQSSASPEADDGEDSGSDFEIELTMPLHMLPQGTPAHSLKRVRTQTEEQSGDVVARIGANIPASKRQCHPTTTEDPPDSVLFACETSTPPSPVLSQVPLSSASVPAPVSRDWVSRGRCPEG